MKLIFVFLVPIFIKDKLTTKDIYMLNRTYSQTSSAATINEGLRQYMIKVYNFMAAGLCLTALSAYLVANTPLLRLFFTLTPEGGLALSGFGWLMFIAPLIMVFAFGWVINRGTAAQVQTYFWG